MEKSSIAIIIPSYNPTDQLNKLIDSLRLSVSNPIVVVNDGSDPAKYQHFFEKIKSHPDVTILEHEKNLGKGRALKTAFSHCLEQKYPAAVTADSICRKILSNVLTSWQKIRILWYWVSGICRAKIFRSKTNSAIF